MDAVEFDTEYGPVGVAVRRDASGYGDQPVARVQEVIIESAISLKDSLSIIRPLAEAVIAQVTGLANRADEVQAEFSLELGGKGRFVVAEAHATASVKVTLTWKPKA